MIKYIVDRAASTLFWRIYMSLRWRHDGRDSVSNHQPHDCLLNRLFRCRSKKTSKLRVTGLCVGNSPGTGEFSAQMASNAENVSIWWRHHVIFNSTVYRTNQHICLRLGYGKIIIFSFVMQLLTHALISMAVCKRLVGVDEEVYPTSFCRYNQLR